MASKKTPKWLARVVVESALIVASILVALALDEWREDREDEEMIQRALGSFLSEIERNRVKVEEAAPFNQGLRLVLARRYRNRDIDTVDEFVNTVGSYDPLRLQATAWETALATGSLAKMDYELVSALSMAYILQDRYLTTSQGGMTQLTSTQNLSADKLDLAVYNSIRFLDRVIRMEAELETTYELVQTVVYDAMTGDNGMDQSKENQAASLSIE
jgi:hypothetical protein